MKNKLNELITEYPFYVGSFCLILGVVLLIYKISKEQSFRMKDYNVITWKLLVDTWVFILMLIMLGIALIFRE
tara:strand:- start:1742 stop:1960 length:219 start_codon:yes stop_codon:yes gene_type:complete